MTPEQILDAYNQKLARIEGNRTYSDNAKRVLAAKAYTETQTAMDQLRASDSQQLRDRRNSLQRHMFGHADSSDPATLLARRGAVDRANELDDQRTAREALQEALRQGDGILAQAIAKRANDWGWSDVLGAYAESRPHFQRAAEEYDQLPDPDDNGYRITSGFQYMAPTPSSLSNASTQEINRLASQDLGETA